MEAVNLVNIYFSLYFNYFSLLVNFVFVFLLKTKRDNFID